MKNYSYRSSLLLAAVVALTVFAQGCGNKTVESGSSNLTGYNNQYGYPNGYPYPYPSGTGTGSGYAIPVMQYAYGNPNSFPRLNPADPTDYRAITINIQVQAGDRLVLYSGSQGGHGVSRTRWGIFQTCSTQVPLGGAGGRGALWASDGVRTYPIGMGGQQIIQNAGTLRIGFDVDEDGQNRCYWIPSSLVLIRQ